MTNSAKSSLFARALWLVALGVSASILTDELFPLTRDWICVPAGRGPMVIRHLSMAIGAWAGFVAVYRQWDTRMPQARRSAWTLAWPLFAAVSWVHFAAVPFPPVPLTPEEQNYRQLVSAIREHRLNAVNTVIVSGVDVNYTPMRDGWTRSVATTRLGDFHTPLTVAVMCGDIPAAKALVDNGATLPGEEGSLAYQTAVEKNDLPMMRWLLESRTKIATLDESQNCSIFMAAIVRGEADMVSLLLAHGADPNCSRIDDVTAMELARFRHESAIVKLLLNAGAKS